MILALNDLRVTCIIGDLPEEREKEQTLRVDVSLTVGEAVATSDQLTDGVDYAMLARAIRDELIAAKCRLIERAAALVCDVCLKQPMVSEAHARVTKSGCVQDLASATAEATASRASTATFPEYELAGVEVIARGVCIQDGHLLLCRAKGSATTYLPGGHIEFGETGRVALAREMMEEAACEIKVTNFLGCVENSFLQHQKPHAEINLVYEMTLATHDVVAQENHIEFIWWPLASLDRAHLLPDVFLRLAQSPLPTFQP